MSDETHARDRVREQVRIQMQALTALNYGAPAELFPCPSKTRPGQFKYKRESSTNGNESSFESFIRYFQLYSGDAGDPASDEEVWIDSRGQWFQLVFQWRSRYALE